MSVPANLTQSTPKTPTITTPKTTTVSATPVTSSPSLTTTQTPKSTPKTSPKTSVTSSIRKTISSIKSRLSKRKSSKRSSSKRRSSKRRSSRRSSKRWSSRRLSTSARFRKSPLLKFKYSLYSALAFFLLASPQMFTFVNNILGGFVKIAEPNGCPTAMGLMIHTIVFLALLYFMMSLPRDRY